MAEQEWRPEREEPARGIVWALVLSGIVWIVVVWAVAAWWR